MSPEPGAVARMVMPTAMLAGSMAVAISDDQYEMLVNAVRSVGVDAEGETLLYSAWDGSTGPVLSGAEGLTTNARGF